MTIALSKAKLLPGCSVTVTDALWVASATLVAVTVTVCCVAIQAGAV
jgi:hypothetical protein